MRKGQAEILERARVKGLTDEQISLLAREDIKLTNLNKIFCLFSNIKGFPCDDALIRAFLSESNNYSVYDIGWGKYFITYEDYFNLPEHIKKQPLILSHVREILKHIKGCDTTDLGDAICQFCDDGLGLDLLSDLSPHHFSYYFRDYVFNRRSWTVDRDKMIYLYKFCCLFKNRVADVFAVELKSYNIACLKKNISNDRGGMLTRWCRDKLKSIENNTYTYCNDDYASFIRNGLPNLNIYSKRVLSADVPVEENVEHYIRLAKETQIINPIDAFDRLPRESTIALFASEDDENDFNYVFEKTSLLGKFNIQSIKTSIWRSYSELDYCVVSFSESQYKVISLDKPHSDNSNKSVSDEFVERFKFMILSDGCVYGCSHSSKGKWRPTHIETLLYYLSVYPLGDEILDAIMTIPAIKESYVFKDLISDYKASKELKISFPPLIWNKCIGYKNRNHLMKSYYKNTEGINFNKLGISAGYTYMKTKPYVRDSCQDFLRNLFTTKAIVGYTYTIGRKRSNVARKVLEKYFIDKFSAYRANNDVEQEVADYVSACLDNKVKINMKYQSLRKMSQKTTDIILGVANKKTSKIIIPKNSDFKPLVDALDNSRFEYIKTRNRIIAEGELMSHCVASYADEVNRDHSAIFHLTYNDIPYTVEFCKEVEKGKGSYYINQIQGKCNRGAPREVIAYVRRCIKDVNYEPQKKKGKQ